MLSLLLALYLPQAHAVAPSQDTWIGVEPNRVWRFHDGEQTRLRHTAAWQEFLSGDGLGWFARFDEASGTPHRAWGPGIPLRDVRDAAAVEASLRELLEMNPSLAGVPLDQLRLRAAGHVARTDTWYVDFDRMVSAGGQTVPVWRGGLTFRVRGGEVVMLGVDSYPQFHQLGAPTVSMAAAQRTAVAKGPAPAGAHTDATGSLVALPWVGAHGLELRLCWELRSRTEAPLGRWVSFVDARTGELLSVHNEIQFFDGVIQGTHDTRYPDGSFTTSPMPLERFSGSDGSREYAGEDGSFSLSDEESWTTALTGEWLTVNNQQGSEGSMSVSGSSPTWTASYASQAEIDSYKFLHDVRTWCLDTAPEVGICNDRLDSNVNLNSTCNAYYDGDVNFYRSGGSCNNTGQIADVNYHEWGHGFHYTSLEAGTFDNSISEGIGDTVSSIQTHDYLLAPYFYTNGGAIRELDTNYVYPDDVTGEVHQDGLIFAGAVWDTWEALYTTYGETRADNGQAHAVISQLLADGIKGGPTIPDSYDEFVVADDDDGDVTNGTPHICEIVDGFGQHGLGPSGGASLLMLDHLAVENQPALVPIPFTGSVLNLAADCNEFTLQSATVHYSVDGGESWSDVEGTVSGDNFQVVLDGLPEGTIVHYWVEASSAEGDEVVAPTGGDIAPYSFYVGGLTLVRCDDFESSDGGYTHELISGNDRTGADDWMWDTPRATGGDPESAFSGRKVWGNDLGGTTSDGQQYNGQYQPSIVNRLTSSAFDVGGSAEVIVQFRRWLGVEDSLYDQANLYANDTRVWVNHAANRDAGDESTEDGEWKLHTTRVSGLSGSLTLGWEIDSDNGLEFGGWTIDDVCVYAPLNLGELLHIDDFVASDDQEGQVTLSWTQPADSSATQAVVVRRADRFATTRDDGDLVYVGDVVPGAPMTAIDASVGSYYYTVFAGGSAGWLSGAEEGANADLGTGLDGGANGGDNGGNGGDNGGDNGDVGGDLDDTGGLKINPPGCGCSTSEGGGLPLAGGLAGLLALAGLRRRRGERA